MRNQKLRRLTMSDMDEVEKVVPSQNKELKGFEKFSLYFRRILNVSFTVLEALVLFSIFFVTLKYCCFVVLNDTDYKKIYDLIKFLKDNYQGAILLFLLIFSRTCLNMLYNIRVFRIKDLEMQMNETDRMWDIK